MRRIFERTKHSWRILVTTFFVFMVFTVPGTKGIVAKFITVNASGETNVNLNDSDDSHDSSASHTASSGMSGAPQSADTGSPMNHSDSCSTGRRHSQSHHGHDRSRHPHYRPNGY